MDYKELRDLIRILEESGLSEIEVEEDGRRIRLQKLPVPPAYPPAAPAPASKTSEEAAASGGALLPETEDTSPNAMTFDSPMVGTFYRAPAPGEEAFVKVGDDVAESQTVCIVEAMKLMNEVGAKFAGIIEKILVENGQPVEFGQPLFAVRIPE